jgi:hypothetical protein
MILRRFWRNGPIAACLVASLVLMAAALSASCDKVALTAPTDSTISLFADSTSVPVNGTIQITASVTESAGTPVQNGTVVTFTTTLGRLDPAEARTNNGKVTVRLAGDGRSGTASITAFSGGNQSEALEIPIGGAAANNIVLRADPASLGSAGGTVQLTATVRDEAGNPLAGVSVTFTATAGRLGASSVTTDANGQASTTLSTTQQSEVTVQAGAQTATATIQVNAAPTVQVTVTPTQPFAGEPTSFAINVTASEGPAVQSMSIEFGDGFTRQLGSSSTTVQHIYESDGTFTVTVRVRDSANQTTTQVAILTVLEPGAVPVDVAVDSEAPVAGEAVAFTATATTGESVSIERYEWNFGDNTAVQTTSGPSNAHVYAVAGSYVVKVHVVASNGAEGDGQTAVAVQ